MLEGTVLLPESPGPVPGVVLLGGSNWTNRGTVRGEAELLAAAGVAVLIFGEFVKIGQVIPGIA